MLFRFDQFYDESEDYVIRKMKMKKDKNIIFLDIDGVIGLIDSRRRYERDIEKTAIYLSEKYHDDIYLTLPHYELGRAYFDWDFSAIGTLRKLIEETRSHIVVHSGWIDQRTLVQIKAYFRLHDLDQFIIELANNKLRKEDAIDEYLSNHPDIDHYIVIDDDSSLLMHFGENCCHTSHFFTIINYEYCEMMLKTNFRIEHKIEDNKSKFMLFDLHCENEFRVASLYYKIIEHANETICLFHICAKDGWDQANYYLILLNHAIAYFYEKNITAMVANTDDILNRRCNVAREASISVKNKETNKYESTSFITISLHDRPIHDRAIYNFLKDHRIMVLKELDELESRYY